MALPLLLVAGAAGLGLFGAGKTIKAAMDNSEANDLNDSANSIVSNAKNKIDSARKQSGKAFETLGAKKVAILNGSIAKFIDRINQIKNFPFDTSINNGNLKFDAKSFEELKQMQEYYVFIQANIDENNSDRSKYRKVKAYIIGKELKNDRMVRTTLKTLEKSDMFFMSYEDMLGQAEQYHRDLIRTYEKTYNLTSINTSKQES